MAEKTTEEIRDEFLAHLAGLVRYWDRVDGTSREKLNGLAFSILTTLDGCCDGMPAFIVAPCPHPDDKAFHEADGDDWYPENEERTLRGEITNGVMLHEMWNRYRSR